MVSATMDPLAQTEEKWTVETQDVYLVVFATRRFGCRLYLFRHPTVEVVAKLHKVHGRSEFGTVDRDIKRLIGWVGDQKDNLIYDTTWGGQIPIVEEPSLKIIYTGE